MRPLITLLVVLVVLGAVVGETVLYAEHQYEAPGPLPAARNVVVPHGGVVQVAAALTKAGVIDDPILFRVAARLTRGRGTLHAAELAFPAHASLRQVLEVLRTAPPVEYKLTIPEGLTAAQIAQLLASDDRLSGPAVMPREGEMLPQTYEYERGTKRSAIVARARAAMQRALAHAWTSRVPGLPLKSPRQALILASIVERETAKPGERPRVAAVFLNRLRQGMRLQSDPTVIYGASGGLGELDHPLTRAELDAANPYNTYRIDGLPPGPICSPGIASIEAVLHPADSEDLYFVADGTGGHAFAQTLQQQNRNVARYRALENGTAQP